eukprot:467217-Pyramimonas_sp.AAC.1
MALFARIRGWSPRPLRRIQMRKQLLPRPASSCKLPSIAPRAPAFVRHKAGAKKAARARIILEQFIQSQ